jgi:hypothetical protein
MKINRSANFSEMYDFRNGMSICTIYYSVSFFVPRKNIFHFAIYDAVIAAVRKWLASSGADFYERGIQALVHRWQKCIMNGGDYVEK